MIDSGHDGFPGVAGVSGIHVCVPAKRVNAHTGCIGKPMMVGVKVDMRMVPRVVPILALPQAHIR